MNVSLRIINSSLQGTSRLPRFARNDVVIAPSLRGTKQSKFQEIASSEIPPRNDDSSDEARIIQMLLRIKQYGERDFL